jgi:hypothetical protein
MHILVVKFHSGLADFEVHKLLQRLPSIGFAGTRPFAEVLRARGLNWRLRRCAGVRFAGISNAVSPF